VPVVPEMLQRSNAVPDAMQTSNKARVRVFWHEPAIRHLTVYCEWNTVVLDERRASGRAAAPEGPYVGTAGLWAGDWVSNTLGLHVLHGVQSSAELFDLFSPAMHTVFVFVRKNAATDVDGFGVEIVRCQSAGTCAIMLDCARASESASSTVTDAFLNTKGHATQFYDVKQSIRAAVVRPVEIFAAMVRTTSELGHALGLVFDNT
jgi:hypothetical protein